MEEVIQYIHKLIKQLTGSLSSDEQFYAVSLYQLTVYPNEAILESISQELLRRTDDASYLTLLSSNRRFELLALACAIQQCPGKQNQLSQLNEALFRLANQDLYEGKWSYVGGVAGILYYFTRLEPTEQITFYVESLLEAIAVFIEELSETDLKDQWQEFHADYSLGKGLIGWLMALLNALETIQGGKRTHSTAKTIATYLYEQVETLGDGITVVDSQLDNYSFFPRWAESNSNTIVVSNVISWSEGDLGQVSLFYKAAQVLGIPTYEAIAEQIGLYTLTRRTINSTEITHSNLCSGSLGLAFIYRALCKRNIAYNAGYAYWQQESLILLNEDLKANHFETNPFDLLDGLIGVALLLHSFSQPAESDNWTKMLSLI